MESFLVLIGICEKKQEHFLFAHSCMCQAQGLVVLIKDLAQTGLGLSSRECVGIYIYDENLFDDSDILAAMIISIFFFLRILGPVNKF